MSAMRTWAPSRAKRMVVSRPMPLERGGKGQSGGGIKVGLKRHIVRDTERRNVQCTRTTWYRVIGEYQAGYSNACRNRHKAIEA